MARSLPALFTSYHTLVLLPRLNGMQGAQRNEREARTLCEILDGLVEGRVLPAMMVALQRLKAIEASLDQGVGGWNVARQMEITARPGAGLVSQRDRTAAQRDQRDEARSLQPRAQQPLAGRGNRG